MSSKALDVPRRPEDWERVLEAALGRANSESLYLDLEIIKRHAAYMAGDPINPDLVVHCETKLFWGIFRAERSDQRIPKAYSYLGVSKLSCHGCASFVDGFNKVHKTGFMTRGSHGKSYYPWQFPSGNFSKRDELIEATYKLISDSWVNSYNGYRPKFICALTRPQSLARRDGDGPRCIRSKCLLTLRKWRKCSGHRRQLRHRLNLTCSS
jgi:hypothetical protein